VEGSVLQFYFLSIAANLIGGFTLCSDWFVGKLSGLGAIVTALSVRRAKMATGLATLLVGFGTLFVPADGRIVLGDLFPSVMGMAMGVALLFEVFKQDALFPAERVDERADRVEKMRSGYRIAIGALGLAAAVLHFFLPDRLIL
jgi:hypothetical protein